LFYDILFLGSTTEYERATMDGV